jgi:hypothetical protein
MDCINFYRSGSGPLKQLVPLTVRRAPFTRLDLDPARRVAGDVRCGATLADDALEALPCGSDEQLLAVIERMRQPQRGVVTLCQQAAEPSLALLQCSDAQILAVERQEVEAPDTEAGRPAAHQRVEVWLTFRVSGDELAVDRYALGAKAKHRVADRWKPVREVLAVAREQADVVAGL